MSAAVVVDNVSKRYRIYHERNDSLKASLLRRRRGSWEDFWALREVSLEVEQGTTFGLIGANGSGKSTLLKCLAKILQPNSGRVSVRGSIAALLELGAGFHPELSGRENVYLNGAILGLGRRELSRAFDEIVSFAGLESFIDMPVKTYSSGMYVRLGFSIAINVQPEVLLVDEVLAVGDAEFQRGCAEKFADMRRAGRTVVVVSHDMGAVRNLCDRLAWLEDGRVREIGAPGNVADAYVGNVLSDRESRADGEARRWGSGEVRIEHAEVLDGEGRATRLVRTGDPVIIRLHYRASRRVDAPVFGIAVVRIDGAEVTGPNTRDVGLRITSVSDTGVVDLVIDRLMLLPATYDLSAAVYDDSLSHAYDHRHRAFRFEVGLGTPREKGLVSLGGQWRVEQAKTIEGVRSL